MAKTKVADKPVIELNVDELKKKMRACCMATAYAVNHGIVTTDDEKKCYRQLFKLVTGRNLTVAELNAMTLGDDKL